jgi:hypothetical protein
MATLYSFDLIQFAKHLHANNITNRPAHACTPYLKYSRTLAESLLDLDRTGR